MNENLFKLILALIPVLGTILTAYIIPFIKEKIGNEKLEKYKKWAKMAVESAEMLWTESGKGSDKKQFVIDYLNDLFNSKKVVITEEQLNILIESAVLELNKNK